jgi:hypothetical protein
MCSIELKRDHSETQEACLSGCGQLVRGLIKEGPDTTLGVVVP